MLTYFSEFGIVFIGAGLADIEDVIRRNIYLRRYKKYKTQSKLCTYLGLSNQTIDNSKLAVYAL
jgi:hypothetical protein